MPQDLMSRGTRLHVAARRYRRHDLLIDGKSAPLERGLDEIPEHLRKIIERENEEATKAAAKLEEQLRIVKLTVAYFGDADESTEQRLTFDKTVRLDRT